MCAFLCERVFAVTLIFICNAFEKFNELTRQDTSWDKNNMTTKLDQKIIGYEIVKNATGTTAVVSPSERESPERAEIIQMHERLERPEMLLGSTYKIKTPLSDHALYVTINDIVLNQGTEHELRRPFEIFINSKNMDHFQWIVALTRIISAVFRKGGDVTFLVDELHSVFDPKGGYFKKGGRYMHSLVAEIGDAIESHMKMIGMIESPEMDDGTREHVALKREQHANHRAQAADDTSDGAFPAGASLCGKCHTLAVFAMDGCMTCLNCGDSRCG